MIITVTTHGVVVKTLSVDVREDEYLYEISKQVVYDLGYDYFVSKIEYNGVALSPSKTLGDQIPAGATVSASVHDGRVKITLDIHKFGEGEIFKVEAEANASVEQLRDIIASRTSAKKSHIVLASTRLGRYLFSSVNIGEFGLVAGDSIQMIIRDDFDPPLDEPNDPWICPKCSLINDKYDRKCTFCSAAQPLDLAQYTARNERLLAGLVSNVRLDDEPGLMDEHLPELLAAIEKAPELVGLALGLNGLSDAGLIRVAHSAAKNPNLREFWIETSQPFTDADKTSVAILEALATSASLKELEVQREGPLAYVVEHGVAPLCAKSTTLTRLSLSCAAVGPVAMKALVSAICSNQSLKLNDFVLYELYENDPEQISKGTLGGLCAGVTAPLNVQKLDLCPKKVEFKDSQALFNLIQSPNFKSDELVLRPGKIGSCKPFFPGLANNTTLTSLDMSTSQIPDGDGAALADALKANKTLRFVDLSDTGLKDATLAALGEVVKVHPALQRLSLGDMPVSPKTATIWADAIRTSKPLKDVALTLKAESVQAIVDAIEASSSVRSFCLVFPVTGSADPATARLLSDSTTLDVYAEHSLDENPTIIRLKALAAKVAQRC